MSNENTSAQQSADKIVFQKMTKAAVSVMLKPEIYWESKSIKSELDGKGVIFVCNHTHHFDGIFAGAVFDKYKAYAVVVSRWYDKPKIGQLIKKARTIKIDPESMDISWYQTAEELLKKGCSIIIFPEGQIAREGKMNTFQPGAALLSIKTGAPIVPAAIYGDYSFAPNKSQRMLIGKPIYPECPDDMRTSKYARILTEQAEKSMRRLYGALEFKFGKLPVYEHDSFTD